MQSKKEKYQAIKEYREMLSEELLELEENELIKKYLKIKKENEELSKKQKELYLDYKKEEYDHCDHLLVCAHRDKDFYEGRTYTYYGCVKCGLDETVLAEDELKVFGMPGSGIMYDYLKERRIRNIPGKRTNISCDIQLAHAIYKKIIEAHPDINDELATHYITKALIDINNNKVNEERKISRAKRLELKSSYFNRTHNI